MKKLLLILLFVPLTYCSSDSGSEATTPPPTTTTPPPVVNYNLTVSAGDGGAVSSTGGTYASGESVSITATANAEYVFSGWSNGSTDNPLSVTMSSNQTITASFEKVTYTLSTSTEGEGTVTEVLVSSGRTADYNSGSVVQLTAVPSDGWSFNGWTGDYVGVENPIEVDVTQAKSFNAVFEALPLVSSTYLGTNCKEVSYSSKPDADYVNGDYSYYTYGWQSDGTDQNSCVNAYNGVTTFGVDLVNAVLSDAKEKLGQIVPVNAWIFHTQNSDVETICSDYSPFTDDSSCFDLQQMAAATVTQYVLHNGGEFRLSEIFWSDEEQNGAGYRVAYHEFFHIHQNSHKFYFEETENFGINMTQFRNVDDNEGVNLVGPVWLEEGGAEFAGVWYSSLKGWVNYNENWINYLDEARSVISDAASRGDIVSLRDYETRYSIQKVESSENPTGTSREFAYAYSGGGLAHIYLISKGFTDLNNSMIEYYRNIAELEREHIGEGYIYAFEEYFGMSLDSFYTEFDDFMLKPREEQLSILGLE